MSLTVRMRKVCYRTSQQIRRAADKLLPEILRATNGLDEERVGIVSIFSGPPSEIRTFENAREKADNVRAAIAPWLSEGIASH